VPVVEAQVVEVQPFAVCL